MINLVQKLVPLLDETFLSLHIPQWGEMPMVAFSFKPSLASCLLVKIASEVSVLMIHELNFKELYHQKFH